MNPRRRCPLGVDAFEDRLVPSRFSSADTSSGKSADSQAAPTPAKSSGDAGTTALGDVAQPQAAVPAQTASQVSAPADTGTSPATDSTPPAVQATIAVTAPAATTPAQATETTTAGPNSASPAPSATNTTPAAPAASPTPTPLVPPRPISGWTAAPGTSTAAETAVGSPTPPAVPANARIADAGAEPRPTPPPGANDWVALGVVTMGVALPDPVPVAAVPRFPTASLAAGLLPSDSAPAPGPLARVLDVVAPDGVPLAGLLPSDVAALDAGIGALLARLPTADAPADEWGDAEQWAWAVAAALVAGGVGYSARPHRGRGRTDRITLGTDSATARGEDDHAGGPV